jgi:hypothetical protein
LYADRKHDGSIFGNFVISVYLNTNDVGAGIAESIYSLGYGLKKPVIMVGFLAVVR